MGPNVRKLICQKMAADIVPPGSGSNAVGAVVDLLKNPETLKTGVRSATEFVQTAIRLVREAPGGAAYGDDEAIAGEILRQIEEKKKR